MNTRHRFSRECRETRLRCLRPDNIRLKYQRQKKAGILPCFIAMIS